MLKIKIQKDKTIWIDGIKYDKMSVPKIVGGVLTVKVTKVSMPSGKKITTTIRTSSFSIFEEK